MKIRSSLLAGFHLFFVPFIACFPRSTKVRKLALLIQYIPVLLISLGLYIVVNGVFYLIPAFVKCLLIKSHLMCEKRTKQSKSS